MNSLRSTHKAFQAAPTYLHSRRDFNDFYDQYAPMLYGYLLRQTENGSLADLILAASFVTFWQERIAFNEHQAASCHQAPLSWLLNIAHRKKSEFLRSPLN
ncbi:RNA polymerase sigma factor [Spirosoma aerophilum]